MTDKQKTVERLKASITYDYSRPSPLGMQYSDVPRLVAVYAYWGGRIDGVAGERDLSMVQWNELRTHLEAEQDKRSGAEKK